MATASSEFQVERSVEQPQHRLVLRNPGEDNLGFFKGLLIALPLSVLLWAGIIYCIRAVL